MSQNPLNQSFVETCKENRANLERMQRDLLRRRHDPQFLFYDDDPNLSDDEWLASLGYERSPELTRKLI